jgi:hypothetical protein
VWVLGCGGGGPARHEHSSSAVPGGVGAALACSLRLNAPPDASPPADGSNAAARWGYHFRAGFKDGDVREVGQRRRTCSAHSAHSWAAALPWQWPALLERLVLMSFSPALPPPGHHDL